MESRTRHTRFAHPWARGLTALLLALLVSLGATPPATADGERPPGAAQGRDLSKTWENPLLAPPLEPVEQLRFELWRRLPKADKDLAFDRYRNGAAVFLDPTKLDYDDQIKPLLYETTTFSSMGSEAWTASIVPLDPLRDYLKPGAVRRLDQADVSRLLTVSALNIQKSKHSEAVLQRVLDKYHIGGGVVLLGSSERQQCSRCARLYAPETPTAYGRAYDLSVREWAQRAKDITQARKAVAQLGPEAELKAEKKVKRKYERLRKLRNGTALDKLVTDLDEVQKKHLVELGDEPPAFSVARTCPHQGSQSLRLRQTTVLAAAAKAAGPCDEAEDSAAAKASAGSATGLGSVLASPGMGTGGIDFSSMELRYLSDPGDGSGLQYSFSADFEPLKGDARTATGRGAVSQSSDAFFVWLSLTPQDFWVNLNPDEPDRIVDDRLGRTDAGRVLLEADLRMKKTVGKLIHPHSALGRKFWEGVRGDCMSFRNWILPAPASVHQDGDRLYILDAPLDVQMETQYLKDNGVSSAPSCPEQDQATEDHNEAHFRRLILPELKEAINTAPEYAALRRVYLARVAAEWYRDLSLTKKTTYGDLIDSGDIDAWRTADGWQPTDTFDRYVDSYTKGEFKITDRTTSGDTTYVRSYVYGGVDLTDIPVKEVADERFTADFAGLSERVDRSLNAPSAADGDETVWLGSPTPRQAAGLAPPEEPVSLGTWALRLLPALLVPLLALLWWRRHRLNTGSQASPLRRAAVGGRRR
ncbi:hypothetical protein QQM39_30260 [Streptomyces sp. DT2A-34]|uniref:hypothetical protein n=1 Tax=Streptomyces sp. DT2A-34 TaxID=3051182 RepID=UPI00265BFE3E|nr:hypothetical protein [Streptomyces sp. DT2A-34]MDO0914955.1 hypothetical protein [Streptomyces sp. DT2A-34]